MKKRLMSLISIIIIFSISGCTPNAQQGITDLNHSSTIETTSDEINSLKITADEVVRCFDEDDVDALKLLFCKNTLYGGDVDVNKQVMIGSIDFSGHEEMYTSFVSETERNDKVKDYIICDEDNLTVWIIWYSEEVT